jgi:hypothetical protein
MLDLVLILQRCVKDYALLKQIKLEMFFDTEVLDLFSF